MLDVTTGYPRHRGGSGPGGVAYYAALRFLRLVEQVAPLSVLAGGLFASAQLARENAVIARRATGLSVYRLVGMALPAVACVVLIDYVTVEVIAPRTDPVLEAWWRDTAKTRPDAAAPRPFRAGADLIVARAGDVGGDKLGDLKIYRRDAAGRITERVEAASAPPMTARAAGGSTRPKIVRFGQDAAMSSAAASMVWNPGLRPPDVQTLLSPSQMPTAASARRAPWKAAARSARRATTPCAFRRPSPARSASS